MEINLPTPITAKSLEFKMTLMSLKKDITILC